MSTSSLPPILLTGASGVVGQALLPLLGHREVVALTHRATVAGEHVTSVRGDLTQPRFGLAAADYAALADRIGVVVHCAAITGFAVGKDDTDELNIRGTQNIVEFARAAGAPLTHVSTAFVARGDLRRDEGSVARPEVYIESKQAGERFVLDSGLAVNIVRPAVVVGDSVTGAMAQFQAFHSIVGAVLKSQLPMVPLEPEARVDIVPQDLVARVILDLIDTGVTGEERWVTCGTQALTAREIIEMAVQVGTELGLAPTPPRFVAPAMVQRLIRPVFISSLPERQRQQFDDMFAITALLGTDRPFPQDLGPNIAALTHAELIDAWRASLGFYARHKGLVRDGEAAA